MWARLADGIAALLLQVARRGYASAQASQEQLLARALGRMTTAQAKIAHKQIGLAKANAEIIDNDQRVLARAARLAEHRAQTGKGEAVLAKRAASTDAMIAKLRLSGTGPRAPCTLPPAARKALEGL